MFRNRQFLFGLGLGLILGAVLLQLMLSAGTQKEKLGQLDTMGDGSGQTYSREEVDKLIDDAVKNAVADASRQEGANASAAGKDGSGSAGPAASGGEAAGKTDGGQAAGADAKPDRKTEQTSDKTSQPEDAADVKVRIVRIAKGSTSEEVAALLKAKGIVKDEKAFVRLMADSATRIQVGKFLFIGDPSPEKVKGIITGAPFAS